jgi:hypothetical protein
LGLAEYGTEIKCDVLKFLGHLLGLPVSKQSALFRDFFTRLESEIAAAKADGRYNEGIVDITGQSIEQGQTPTLLHNGAQHTTVLVDRGYSFEVASRNLQDQTELHEGQLQPDRPNLSGFYKSKFVRFGTNLVVLAIQKLHGNSFTIIRPSTGRSVFEEALADLRTKYVSVDAAEAEQLWRSQYQLGLAQCAHGPKCKNGSTCTVGKRVTELSLLVGRIVPSWNTIQTLIDRYSPILEPSYRSMRIVRLQVGDKKIIGMLFPKFLIETLTNELAASQLLSQTRLVMDPRTGTVVAVPLPMANRSETMESPTAVDPKTLARALQPAKTLKSFFSMPSSSHDQSQPKGAAKGDDYEEVDPSLENGECIHDQGDCKSGSSNNNNNNNKKTH